MAAIDDILAEATITDPAPTTQTSNAEVQTEVQTADGGPGATGGSVYRAVAVGSDTQTDPVPGPSGSGRARPPLRGALQVDTDQSFGGVQDLDESRETIDARAGGAGVGAAGGGSPLPPPPPRPRTRRPR